MPRDPNIPDAFDVYTLVLLDRRSLPFPAADGPVGDRRAMPDD